MSEPVELLPIYLNTWREATSVLTDTRGKCLVSCEHDIGEMVKCTTDGEIKIDAPNAYDINRMPYEDSGVEYDVCNKLVLRYLPPTGVRYVDSFRGINPGKGVKHHLKNLGFSVDKVLEERPRTQTLINLINEGVVTCDNLSIWVAPGEMGQLKEVMSKLTKCWNELHIMCDRGNGDRLVDLNKVSQDIGYDYTYHTKSYYEFTVTDEATNLKCVRIGSYNPNTLGKSGILKTSKRILTSKYTLALIVKKLLAEGSTSKITGVEISKSNGNEINKSVRYSDIMKAFPQLTYLKDSHSYVDIDVPVVNATLSYSKVELIPNCKLRRVILEPAIEHVGYETPLKEITLDMQRNIRELTVKGIHLGTTPVVLHLGFRDKLPQKSAMN